LIERVVEEGEVGNHSQKTASLDKWVQNTVKRLVEAYRLLLDEKINLEKKIFGLAAACGTNDDTETMGELVSLVNFSCFIRVRFVYQHCVLQDRAQGIERPGFTLSVQSLCNTEQTNE